MMQTAGKRLFGIASFALAALSTQPSRAGDTWSAPPPPAPIGDGTVSPPPASTGPVPPRREQAARRGSSLVWQPEWVRPQPVEYGVALTFGALALAANSIPVRERQWGRNSVDDAMRSVMRFDDPQARSTSRAIGDGLFYGLMAYPVVIDTLLVAMPRSGDVGWQMLVIDAQSMALSGFTAVTMERTTGRERPYARECRRRTPGYEEDCQAKPEERTQSFPSGHSLMSFTGAGLICAHHSRLPLYGGGFADAAACGLALTGATVQAATRVTADRHYFSDVLVGSTLGLASGYLLPMVLHYGRSPDEGPRTATIAPFATSTAGGLAATGQF